MKNDLLKYQVLGWVIFGIPCVVIATSIALMLSFWEEYRPIFWQSVISGLLFLVLSFFAGRYFVERYRRKQLEIAVARLERRLSPIKYSDRPEVLESLSPSSG